MIKRHSAFSIVIGVFGLKRELKNEIKKFDFVLSKSENALLLYGKQYLKMTTMNMCLLSFPIDEYEVFTVK